MSQSNQENRFRDFGLQEKTLASLERMGYSTPTEVQSLTIPKSMSGRDLIVQSRTGTGKTAAFGIRITEAVDRAVSSIQALVLTPTRELTLQVTDELSRIGHDAEVLGAVSVVGPETRMNGAVRERVLPALVKATQEISRAAGYGA